MLIKKSQIEAMDRDAEKRFIARIVNFVAGEYGGDPQDASLHSLCNTLVRSARSYGFRNESEIATFVYCGVVYGPRFAVEPGLPFAPILEDAELDAEFKAERMAHILDDTARTGGERNS